MNDKSLKGMHPITRDLVAIKTVFTLRRHSGASSDRHFETEQASVIRTMIERNTAEQLPADFFVKSVFVNSDCAPNGSYESIFSVETRIATPLKFISHKELRSIREHKVAMLGASVFRDLLAMFRMFSTEFDAEFSEATIEQTVIVEDQQVLPPMKMNLQSCGTYLTEFAQRNKLKPRQ